MCYLGDLLRIMYHCEKSPELWRSNPKQPLTLRLFTDVKSSYHKHHTFFMFLFNFHKYPQSRLLSSFPDSQYFSHNTNISSVSRQRILYSHRVVCLRRPSQAHIYPSGMTAPNAPSFDPFSILGLVTSNSTLNFGLDAILQAIFTLICAYTIYETLHILAVASMRWSVWVQEVGYWAWCEIEKELGAWKEGTVQGI